MKGISRSFWALVAIFFLAGGLLVSVSLRSGAMELGCWWAPLATLSQQVGACGKPTILLGDTGWMSTMALLGLVATCLIAGVVDLVRVGRRTRHFWAELAALEIPAPPKVSEAAAQAGSTMPTVLRDGRPFCFCRRLLRPEVVVSTAMVADLTPEELAAVLAHETAHVARRDPLRGVMAHAAAAALFFLPVMRDLATGERVAAELGADAVAISVVGRHPLLGALTVALGVRRPVLTGVAEIASLEALDVRLDALVGSRRPPIVLGKKRVSVSIASAALVGVLIVLGPLSSPQSLVVPTVSGHPGASGTKRVPVVVVPGKVTVLPHPVLPHPVLPGFKP